MTVREVVGVLGVSGNMLRKYMKLDYGLLPKDVFQQGLGGRKRFRIEELPFEHLTNSEIAEEYGMSIRYAETCRKKLGLPPRPEHLRNIHDPSTYRTLLIAADFYDWMKETKGHNNSQFTTVDLHEYRYKVRGCCSKDRKMIPRSWKVHQWVERVGTENRLWIWKFTRKFHDRRRKAGLLTQREIGLIEK